MTSRKSVTEFGVQYVSGGMGTPVIEVMSERQARHWIEQYPEDILVTRAVTRWVAVTERGNASS